MDGATSRAQAHLEQLKDLDLPSSHEYEAPTAEFPVPDKDTIISWSTEPASVAALQSAVSSYGQALSPAGTDWNVGRFALLQSSTMYLRDDQKILEAREAYMRGELDQALRLLADSDTLIKEVVCGTWNLRWEQLCDLYHFHPQGHPLWGGPYCGAIYSPQGSKSPFVVIAFKGTLSVKEAILDLAALKTVDATGGDLWDTTVAEGFYLGLFAQYPQHGNDTARGLIYALLQGSSTVRGLIQELMDDSGAASIPVYFTGHSLGAAYATFLYAELINPAKAIANAVPVDLHTLGSPRAGLIDFASKVGSSLVQSKQHSWRIVNEYTGAVTTQDWVTTVPPMLPHGTPFIHIDTGILIGGDPDTPTPMDSEVQAGNPLIVDQNMVLGLLAHAPKNYYYAICNLQT